MHALDCSHLSLGPAYLIRIVLGAPILRSGRSLHLVDGHVAACGAAVSIGVVLTALCTHTAVSAYQRTTGGDGAVILCYGTPDWTRSALYLPPTCQYSQLQRPTHSDPFTGGLQDCGVVSCLGKVRGIA